MIDPPNIDPSTDQAALDAWVSENWPPAPKSTVDLLAQRRETYLRPFTVELLPDGRPPISERVERAITDAVQKLATGRRLTEWDKRWLRYDDARKQNSIKARRPRYALPPGEVVQVARDLLVYFCAALFGQTAMQTAINELGDPVQKALAREVLGADNDDTAKEAFRKLSASGGPAGTLDLSVLVEDNLDHIPLTKWGDEDEAKGALKAARKDLDDENFEKLSRSALLAVVLSKDEAPKTMRRHHKRGRQLVEAVPPNLIEEMWATLAMGHSTTRDRVEVRERFVALTLESLIYQQPKENG